MDRVCSAELELHALASVQDVFIKEMRLVDGALRVVNERGDEYKLDMRTLNVEVVKGSLILRKPR